MAKITINTSMEKPEMISKFSQNIISDAADASKNPTIVINSGQRSPLRQAMAMYDNLAKNSHISYAAPGREVVAVYNINKDKSKDTVLGLMILKINELYEKGKRVSLHCVPDEEYNKLNIIDINKNMPNPRDFAIALLKNPSVKRIITPFSPTASSIYPKVDVDSKRISVDANEPAIHIEIKQQPTSTSAPAAVKEHEHTCPHCGKPIKITLTV